MILDILDNIKNYSPNIKDVLNVCSINTDTDNDICIANLYDYKKISKKIDQKTIEQKRYRNLKKLNVFNNRKITNLNHLKETLVVLDCGIEHDINIINDKLEDIMNNVSFCKFTFAKKRNAMVRQIQHMGEFLSGGIGSLEISELKLRELYCDDNMNITDISHMGETLKVLSCCGISGIDQNSILHLNLEKLKCNDNPKINSLNHMKNTLKILECRQESDYISKKDGCMVGDEGISQLNLREIHFGGNPYITNLNHMESTLEVLDVDGKYPFTGIRLSQKGISRLKLKDIRLSGCIEEINLDHMSNTLISLKMYNYIDISKLKLENLHIAKGGIKELRKYVSVNSMYNTLKSLTVETSGYIKLDDIYKSELRCIILTDPNVILNFGSLKKTVQYMKCSREYYNKHKHELNETKIKLVFI